MTLTMRETLHPKGDEAIHILEPRAAAAVGQSGNFYHANYRSQLRTNCQLLRSHVALRCNVFTIRFENCASSPHKARLLQ